MRLSALLATAVLSSLALLPQQGFSQAPGNMPPVPPQSGGAFPLGDVPESEKVLQAKREAERLALYLADLQIQCDQAKARGDRQEYRRCNNEVKQMRQEFKTAQKTFQKLEQRAAANSQLRQFDALCMFGGNPGQCKKCEGGRVVIDDSQSPGKCKKCENGNVVADNSFLSSCRRCLNGHVVNLNGTSCGKSNDCMEFTCDEGKCVGTPIFTASPCSNLKCCLATTN